MSEQQTQTKKKTDEEIMQELAKAMGENTANSSESQNVHTFLNSVATAEDTTKLGNLSISKDLNELGYPGHTVRGCLNMARISKKIMDNDTFTEYFEAEAEDTLRTSLSKEGFLVKQATTKTEQVADVTKKRKINKGMFGSKKIEEVGGDTTGSDSYN